MKTSIRRLPFWTIQALGVIFIHFASQYYQMSWKSVWGGVALVYINMEILFWIVRSFFSAFYLVLLKYLLFVLLIYFLKDYIEPLSFLLGLSSVFFYIIGLLLGVKKYDSL